MKRVGALCATVLLIFCLWNGVTVSAESPYSGNGTSEYPYLISSAQELVAFAEKVNTGEEYKDCWFKQTKDIDLAGIELPTIGVFGSSHYFYGTYDGDGHVLKNLNICTGGNNALFGQLGGTVMNLGIESGTVSGACVGGIASHTCSAKAIIINCYNKATVNGARAGGIADNFNGTIANCFTDCELNASGKNLGGIISYDAVSVNYCISVEKNGRSAVMPDGCTAKSPETDAKDLAEMMNKNLFYSAQITAIPYKNLNFWTVSDDGTSLVFSQEKSVFSLKYSGVFFAMFLEKAIPYILILLALVATAFVMIKAQKKTKEAVAVETELAVETEPTAKEELKP